MDEDETMLLAHQQIGHKKQKHSKYNQQTSGTEHYINLKKTKIMKVGAEKLNSN